MTERVKKNERQYALHRIQVEGTVTRGFNGIDESKYRRESGHSHDTLSICDGHYVTPEHSRTRAYELSYHFL